MTVCVVRIEDFVPVRADGDDVLFGAGSISKFFTALGVLLLADDGVLALDADLATLSPRMRVPASGITLRALLAHTAGASVSFFPGYERGTELPTLMDVLDGRPPAVTEPVTIDAGRAGAFEYSGGGYAVVQRVLEEVTGTPFAQLMREVLLDRLGLDDSTFEQPLPPSLHERAARDDWHVYPEAAAAGLWTTPHELARAVSATQAARAGGTSPLPVRVAAWVVEPQADIPTSPDLEALRPLGLEPPSRIGLGAFLAAGGSRFGHLGGAYGFTSAFDASTADGSGAVVMSDFDNGFEAVLPALAAAL